MTGKIDFYSYGLKPLFNFEQLVVGNNNQFAVSACQAVAKNPGETYNPLFVYGPPGVGKTHLVQAVAQDLLRQSSKAKVKYVLAVREFFSALDLLVIDDVQYLAQSQSTQEELLHIFNNMQQQNHQVLLASDRPPQQLSNLNKTLRSRLEGGLAIDVKIPDVNTRVEILRKKQDLQGLQIPDEVLLMVAQRLRSNVRELEGFIKRMHAYVTLSHMEISQDLVQSVLHEVMPEGMSDLPPEPVPVPEPLHVISAAPKAPVAAPPPPLQPPPMPHIQAPPVPIPSDLPTIPPVHAAPPPLPVKQAVKPPEPPPAAPPRHAPKAPEAVQPAPRGEESIVDRYAAPDAPAHTNGSLKKNGANPVPPASVQPAAKAPPPPPPPPPPPLPKEEASIPVVDEVTEPEEELGAGVKEIGAVFFFPKGSEQALDSVHKKFQEVIKKHKLKFRLRRVASESYECKGKINYSTFVDVCKRNHVPVAVVIGPPPEFHVAEQDFQDLLSVTLDVQGVSLQLINWGEINKDYRYLNLALDIALVRTR
jgi:hypothetical protein